MRSALQSEVSYDSDNKHKIMHNSADIENCESES